MVTWQQAVRRAAATPSTTMKGVGALQLGGVVWSLLGNLDVVTVGLLLGAGKAGTYSVALRVAEFSAQFVIAISLFFLPEATRLAVQGQRERLIALYRSACRWSAITTLLAAGIGFVTAPQIAEIVLPDKAGTITTLLRILFAGYAVQGALGVSYATLERGRRLPRDLDLLDRGAPRAGGRHRRAHPGLGPARGGVVDADRLRGPEHLVDGAHDLRARGLADRRPLRRAASSAARSAGRPPRRVSALAGDASRGRGLRRVGRRRPGGGGPGAACCCARSRPARPTALRRLARRRGRGGRPDPAHSPVARR